MGTEIHVDMGSGEAVEPDNTVDQGDGGGGSPYGTVSAELGRGGTELQTDSGEIKHHRPSVHYSDSVQTEGQSVYQIRTQSGRVIADLDDAKDSDIISGAGFPETTIKVARESGLLNDIEAAQKQAEAEGRRGPLDAPEHQATPEGMTPFDNASDEMALNVLNAVPEREQQGLVAGLVDGFADGSIDSALVADAADAAGMESHTLQAAVSKARAAFIGQIAKHAQAAAVDPEQFASYLTERRSDAAFRTAVVGLVFGRSLKGFDPLLAAYKNQRGKREQ